MRLAYTAINEAGNVVNDTIDAGDTFAATEALHRKGLFVSEIEPVAATVGSTVRGDWLPNTKGRRLKHLAAFMRHLYVLLQSGTSLTQALSALERQTNNTRWRSIIASLRSSIEDGSSLAAAMEAHPDYFDPITRSLVAAGETSGNLEEMLDRLGRLKRDQLHTRRQVVGALAYPVLVVMVSMNVVTMLVTVVLPRFSELFTMMQVPLPPTTRWLIAGGDFLRDYWWVATAVIVATLVGLWKYFTSAAGQQMVDTALIRLPGVGAISRSFITARIVRLLGVLMGSHVGLIESLQLTRDAAGNSHYAELLQKAEEATSTGHSLSHSFSGTDLISPSVYEAMHNGEQSGTLDTLLITVAEFMDEDNEVLLKAILNIISPAILVLLGLFVGFVAISLFLPLFDLTAAGADGGMR